MGLLSKKADKVSCDFQINFPTSDETFSRLNSDVRGRLTLSIREKLEDILTVEVGLRGLCRTQHVIQGGSGPVFFNEDVPLFSTSNIFFDSSQGDEKSTISSGRRFDVPFAFKFPTDQALPSSCSMVGSSSGNHLSVFYETYVRFHYLSSFVGRKKHFDVDRALHYQGLSNISRPTGAQLVTSTIEFSGGKSGLFKSSKSARKKDLKIQADLVVPQPLILNSTLDSLPITFTYFPTGPMEPGLQGLFEVKALWLKVNQDLKVICQGNKFSISRKHPFLEVQEINEKLDVAKFTYNKQSNAYSYSTTLGQLTGDRTTKLNAFLEEPLMGDFEVTNVFTNNNTFSINLTVNDLQSSQEQKFKFHSGFLFDFAGPQQMGQNGLPPNFVGPQQMGQNGPPPNFVGPQQMGQNGPPSNNYGYPQQMNQNGSPHGYPQQMNQNGPPPNYGYPQAPQQMNQNGPPPNNYGYPQQMGQNGPPPNFAGPQQMNQNGPPPNYGYPPQQIIQNGPPPNYGYPPQQMNQNGPPPNYGYPQQMGQNGPPPNMYHY
ncbi:unnamed protein product [Ambrosiozyma monospora]|uniref:Unnamed protein product n=1 Tax=Ambrosiozyma monospora TaxID=43982 RepID=A0ACB5T781_AMBMO|nr:unnamed protein product [Ambrosiozyma monospora]